MPIAYPVQSVLPHHDEIAQTEPALIRKVYTGFEAEHHANLERPGLDPVENWRLVLEGADGVTKGVFGVLGQSPRLEFV